MKRAPTAAPTGAQAVRIVSSIAVVILISAVLALSRQEGAVNATTTPSPESRQSAAAFEGSTPSSSSEKAPEPTGSKPQAKTAPSTTDAVDNHGQTVTKGEISIAISPSCAARGSSVTVTIQTVPLADISHAVSFSDGNHHNLYGLGQADLEGSYLWGFAVPSDAAFGEAKVLVGSTHPSKGGGSAMGVFQVTDKGECR